MSEAELQAVERACLLAIEELGGIATRCREIRDLNPETAANIVQESRSEIVSWLDQAAYTLAAASSQLEGEKK